MNQQKNKFYLFEKLANDRSIEKSNLKKKNKFFVYAYSIMIFAGIIGTLPTFFGYNFTYIVGQCFIAFYSLSLFFLIYFTIRYLMLVERYKVFKKRITPYLFTAGFYLLAIIMCISAVFTTKYIPNGNSGFIINFNPMFYFFIYLPLFIGYVIFCYYAFLKYFARLSKRK